LKGWWLNQSLSRGAVFSLGCRTRTSPSTSKVLMQPLQLTLEIQKPQLFLDRVFVDFNLYRVSFRTPLYHIQNLPESPEGVEVVNVQYVILDFSYCKYRLK